MTDSNTRCPTGIPGLDELIEGGYPRTRSILVSGTSGSGKSTFGVQFLYNGITQYNEPGILIALEQEPKELKADMMKFGFDLDRMEKDGKLIIIDASLARLGVTALDTVMMSRTFKEQPQGSMSLLPDEFNMERILEIVSSKARKIGAKRAVFDSLPALDFLIADQSETKIKHTIRQLLLAVNYRLKAAGLTTLIITESPNEGSLSAHGVESYVVDGTIELTVNEALDDRTLKIKKMRQTRHTLKPRVIEFTDTGITLKPQETGKKKLF
ncbi:MAG: hypothetical protein JW724_04805 [Candidatus Altiarchaeota archaeon]|nr:hypothetical protein [Candidatus Altiarchaeota archaeon]